MQPMFLSLFGWAVLTAGVLAMALNIASRTAPAVLVIGNMFIALGRLAPEQVIRANSSKSRDHAPPRAAQATHSSFVTKDKLDKCQPLKQDKREIEMSNFAWAPSCCCAMLWMLRWPVLLGLLQHVQALEGDPWGLVRGILKIYSPIPDPWNKRHGLNCRWIEHGLPPDMTFTAGTAEGRRFVFEKGAINMTSQLAMASSSKFPVAMAIAGCVADGHITFDTKAHEIWSWWSSNPKDPKSHVTLRHLLSFTSGFYWPDASGFVPCLGAANASSYTPEAPFEFQPGSTWSYNSFHLQIAGAMAAHSAKMTTQQTLGFEQFV
eukprot:Skav230551  [mRNA]  locus=scaffold1605:86843:91519:- [translate_table: standard]